MDLLASHKRPRAADASTSSRVHKSMSRIMFNRLGPLTLGEHGWDMAEFMTTYRSAGCSPLISRATSLCFYVIVKWKSDLGPTASVKSCEIACLRFGHVLTSGLVSKLWESDRFPAVQNRLSRPTFNRHAQAATLVGDSWETLH